MINFQQVTEVVFDITVCEGHLNEAGKINIFRNLL